MTRTVGEAFNVFLDRLTPTAGERAAAAKHRESVEGALKAALSVNAIRETGSFHHGTGVRGHCDVDVLVSINTAKPGSSDTALGWVKDALRKRFWFTTIRINRPAVVIEFAGGDETWEVIPGFYLDRAGGLAYDIPGAASGWMETAPLAHLEYVNECNQLQKTKGGAKKLARLAKAWKYYNNVPISSFYLEMRAAEHVATQTGFVPVWDICQLLEKLNKHQLAAMNDPKGVVGRFYPCSSDAKKTEALSKLATAATRARKALDATNEGDEVTAFKYLGLLFGGKFPSRYTW